MFPLYSNHFRPNLGDDQRLYWDYDPGISAAEQKILDYSPIALWPLSETIGTVANCLVTPAHDATHVNVTLASILGPDGIAYAPLFDGAAGYVDIFSAALAAAFDGDEGTVVAWIHPKDAWGSVGNEIVIMLYADVNNRIRIYHDTGANLVWRRTAAGTMKNSDMNVSAEDLAWHHVAITWSESAGATGEFIAYFDGAAVDAAQTGIDNYVGSLVTADTCLGAINTTPGSLWNGYLALVAVFDSALNAAAIADIYSLA